MVMEIAVISVRIGYISFRLRNPDSSRHVPFSILHADGIHAELTHTLIGLHPRTIARPRRALKG
jgi:hypothetical protein